MKNLGDALERLVIRHGKALRQAAFPAATAPNADASAADIAAVDEPSVRSKPIGESGRAERLARYEAAQALHEQGFCVSDVSRQTLLDRKTVRKYLDASVFPEIASRPKAPSKFDVQAQYLKRRWEEDGCRNVALLRRELAAKGFACSQDGLNCYLSAVGLRVQTSVKEAAASPPAPRLPAPRRIAWLLTNMEDAAVRPEDRALAQRLCAACPEVKAASELGSAFCRMVRQRRSGDLDRWLTDVADTAPRELQRYAKGLIADKAAVAAALSHEWSNGQTEGQVSRLKYLKRQMYGRAGFDLLRARVLPLVTNQLEIEAASSQPSRSGGVHQKCGRTILQPLLTNLIVRIPQIVAPATPIAA